MIIKARFVAPVDAPVIENGAIDIREGRIESVGPADVLPAKPAEDFGDAVILPGLVNAHTHLELSDFNGRLTPSADFIAWLHELMSVRSISPPTQESVSAAVSIGIHESIRHGVTTVGDITSTPNWTRATLASSPLRAVSFGEVIAIGSRRGLLEERLDAASNNRHATSRLHIGISPHAPYTVEPEGMKRCAQRARSIGAPLCMHLAETSDENTFTQSGGGAFQQYLRNLGVWDDSIPSSGCDPITLARRTQILGPGTLLAHVNYASDDQIACLADSGTNVVYCPRTHHAFDHPPHRFLQMLASDINVCVGTDSLASNPSLSVLDELRFLHRKYPEVSPQILVEMGTIRGALALGYDSQIGTLTRGKVADIVVVPLPETRSDNWTAIFETDVNPIALYIDGEPQSLA